jgi:DNA-binding NarL/FixJ family response regulator
VRAGRPTRVVLADDHNLVRAGVRTILEAQPGFDVVGEAAGGLEALKTLERTTADVLVLDLSMPDMDGFDTLARVKAEHPSIKVLVLTMHTDAEYVARALRQGADGYLLKDSAVNDLVAAIEAVMAGGSYYSPAVQDEIGHLLREGPAPASPLDSLTDREREVLRFVAQGLSTKEIAGRLDISPRTVDTHRANLMRKLDIRSVARLTQFALREGILE